MNISSKSILKLSAVAALAGLPAMAMADTITISINAYSSPLGGGDYGGEFTAATGSGSFVNNGYVASTLMNGGFETFCVESTVDLYSGQSYTYGTSSTTSVGQNLTLGAAYLYYEFATGNLSDYNYANVATINNVPVASRSSDAGQLQAAIWYLMGGQSGYYNYTSANISSDAYYCQALTALGGATAANGNNSGAYGVEVLNVVNGSTPVQNQLVLTGTGAPVTEGSPVPDGGATVLLLGGTLLGAEVLRRKFIPAKA